MTLQSIVGLIGLACIALAGGYAVLALVAVLIWKTSRPEARPASRRPPVTLLKPLCGAEPGLYENLRSFCQQDYPEFQIIFGLHDLADPALAVVRRLVEEFPAVSIDVVVSPQQHGSNRKVSSLLNMQPRARYDVLAMVDSDACVGPDYLSTITAPLLDHKVGLVTCTYRGVPTQGIWSTLGAMYVNEWYMPSVLLAWLFGHQGFASGQTLCLRRDTLQAIGGLRAIANHLADDYQLGELVRGMGQRVVLSSYVVRAENHEPTLDSLMRHEARWMRTIRVLRPKSFWFLCITFSLPMALFGLGLDAATQAVSTSVAVLFWTTLAARLILHCLPWLRGDRSPLGDLWLLPARDMLVCWIWCRTFFRSRITWRGGDFDVDAEGVMRTLS